jgi:hypothetical protein
MHVCVSLNPGLDGISIVTTRVLDLAQIVKVKMVAHQGDLRWRPGEEKRIFVALIVR